MANYRSVFDIIGPVMVGPSSSHTAGAVAIGNAARLIFQKTPKKVVVHYYESFAKTHRGHGTDFAIAGGLLGMAPDDERIPKAPEMVAKAGIKLRFVEEEDQVQLITLILQLLIYQMVKSKLQLGDAQLVVEQLKFA